MKPSSFMDADGDAASDADGDADGNVVGDPVGGGVSVREYWWRCQYQEMLVSS